MTESSNSIFRLYFDQGTTATPSTFEPILKKNLGIASNCAAFEQMPTENIAIIANADKWFVQVPNFPSLVFSKL